MAMGSRARDSLGQAEDAVDARLLTLVCQGRVDVRHVEQRCIEGAEGERGAVLLLVLNARDTETPCKRGDLVEAD